MKADDDIKAVYSKAPHSSPCFYFSFLTGNHPPRPPTIKEHPREVLNHTTEYSRPRHCDVEFPNDRPPVFVSSLFMVKEGCLAWTHSWRTLKLSSSAVFLLCINSVLRLHSLVIITASFLRPLLIAPALSLLTKAAWAIGLTVTCLHKERVSVSNNRISKIKWERGEKHNPRRSR